MGDEMETTSLVRIIIDDGSTATKRKGSGPDVECCKSVK
jgi:hypothetical protein